MSREPRERLVAENIFVNVTIYNMPNIVHISGGVIGALNVGGQQTVSVIDQQIGALKQAAETSEVANALKELTEAIATKISPMTDAQRTKALQQVEVLGQQALLPAEQRNHGVIEAMVNTLANVCSGAGGLATVWEVVHKFFGL